MTLVEARSQVFRQMTKGSKCPCCGQLVKLYRRSLNSSMVLALIALHRLGPGWRHLPSELSEIGATRGDDWSKLRFWGLIEESQDKRMDGGKAGFWRITDKGLAFTNGAIRVHSAVFIYNQTFYGFDSRKTVSVQEALGKKFNYAALMAGTA